MFEKTKNPDNDVSGWFTPSRFFLTISICLFTAFPEVITGVATFVFRDYGIFSYPNAYYLRQSFWKGEIPFWNPLSSCGIPFLAQWNTQVLYPFSFFYLIFPLEWSLTMSNLLHQLFGGIGAYLLLFMLSKNRLGAAVGAIIYTFNGLTMNCVMWQSTIAALGWAPWFISAIYLSVTKSKPLWRAIVTGALQVLAGSPEITMATGVVTLAIILPVIFGKKNNTANTISENTESDSALSCRTSFFGGISKLVLACIAIGVLTSVQIIPFFEFIRESNRSGSYVGSIWSMPIYGWANLIVPLYHCYDSALGVFLQYQQWWTSSYYCSLLGILLVVYAVLMSNQRYIFLLAIVFLSGIALAMGNDGLLYKPLVKVLPFLKMMRYPVKFTLFSMMTMPFFAAEAIRLLTTKCDSAEMTVKSNQNSSSHKLPQFKQLLWIAAVGLAASILILFDNIFYPMHGDNVKFIAINALERWGLTIGIIICIYALLKNYRLQWFYQFAIPILLFVDLLTHNPIQNPTIQPWVYEPNLTRAEWEKDDSLKPLPENGISRVFLRPKDDILFGHAYMKDLVSDYLASRLFLFCNCNILDNFPKTDGFFPVYLKRYFDFYRLLRIPETINPDRLIDLMSASHINEDGKFFHFQKRPSYHPFVTAGREPVFEKQTNILRRIALENFDFGKQVIIEEEFKSLVSAKPTKNWKLSNYSFSPHKITFEFSTDETTLVHISQIFYTKWRAFIDGKETPIFPANYAFQCIQVPPGNHRVMLVYTDTGFIAGLAISAFVLSYILILVFINHRKTN